MKQSLQKYSLNLMLSFFIATAFIITVSGQKKQATAVKPATVDTPKKKPLADQCINSTKPRYYWQGSWHYFTYSGDTSRQVYDTLNMFLKLDDDTIVKGFRVAHYFTLDYNNVERHKWGGEDHLRVSYYDEKWRLLPDSIVNKIITKEKNRRKL